MERPSNNKKLRTHSVNEPKETAERKFIILKDEDSIAVFSSPRMVTKAEAESVSDDLAHLNYLKANKKICCKI